MTGMAGFLSYFTRHRTAANLVLLLVIALGAAAFPKLRSQFFPDIVFDTILVSAEWQGAGAQDIDRAVVQLLEPALQAVEGVVSTNATSFEGRMRITMEFESDWDMARAVDDAKEAAAGVPNLPEDLEGPDISRRGWRDLVTEVVITGPVQVEQLGQIADEFSAELFARGVSQATIRGVEAPRTVVLVPESELVRNDVSLAEIASAISEEAKADPSGEVGSGSRVRTGTEKRSFEQIEQISVRSNPDGSKLLIGDFATVRIEGVDRERAYFVGEYPAVQLRIDRSQKGDAIRLQQTVETLAEELRATVPDGVSIDLIRTRAEAITGRLNVLYSNGLIGLALVVCLLFLFLNARVAFWVAAGIPTAMLATVAMMYALGFSLNMISLFALIITLGIVVDDAIVVGEHAEFRARELGEAPEVAAENAAIRMGLPVFAATITTVIAFMGILAIGGRFGRLVLELPLIVIIVLVASLIECFVILPNHMRHALAHAARNHWYDAPSRVVNSGFNWFKTNVFRRLVEWVIIFRYPVIAGAIMLLSIQAALFISGDVRWRFFNAPELGTVTGNFAMAPGAEREDAVEMMQEMQRAVDETGKKFEERHGENPVKYVVAGIGGLTGRGLSGADTKAPELLGSITVELIDADLRPYSSFEFVGELQDAVRRHPLLETLSFRGGRRGPGGDAIDINLSGAEAQTLKDAAEQLKRLLSAYPEVSGLEDDLAYDKEEVILELTPLGRSLGFTIDGVGRILRQRLGGIEAASYAQGTRTSTIMVQLPEQELAADYLERTMMRTPQGSYVPLGDIVSVDRNIGFSTIKRQNGIHVVSVTGDLSEDDPQRATEIVEALRSDILPSIAEDYALSWELSGLAEQENAFLGDATVGGLLVMLGIFMALAWVFSSWVRPLVVLATVPFGLVGAIYGHYLWGVPFSIFSVVGLMGMTGIIINDSIILISTIDEYSKSRGLVPSIIAATCDRLRPVLLTTMTTVLGLIPLLYETSRQASFLKPTVITLCYGLGFGMLLVLILVPSLCIVQYDIGCRLASLRRAFRVKGNVGGIRVTITGAAFAAAAVFAATIGFTLVEGRLSPAVLLPQGFVESVPPIVAAFAMFVIGLAAVCLAVYAVYATSGRFLRRT